MLEKETLTSTSRWYVVHTQARKEDIAALHLSNQRYEIFLPKCHRIRHHARKKEVILTSLFPRYLFLKMDLGTDPWLPIDSTKGVSYIIRQRNGKPIAMPEGLIDGLQSKQIGDSVPLSSLVLFSPGEKIQILEGSFAGNVALYEGMGGEERVQVLLDILGRDVRVDLSVHQIASL